MRSIPPEVRRPQSLCSWMKCLVGFLLALCAGVQASAQTVNNMYSGYDSVTVPFETPFSFGDQTTAGKPPKINMQIGDYPSGGNPNPIHPFSLDTGSVGITVSTSRPGAALANGQYFKPGTNDILVYSNVSTYYSSSTLTETGSAYLTNVGIFDPASNLMATARVLVLAVTQESCTIMSADCKSSMSASCAGVSPCDYPKFIAYSGVGFRAGMAFAQATTDMLNPFTSLVSIAGVPNAKLRQGYVMTSTGVTLGLSSAATQNFAFIKLGNDSTVLQPNNVTWGHPTGALTINGVTGYAQILVDTGVGTMYLTPAPGVIYSDGKGADGLPASSKITIAIPGMSSAFGMAYDFTTGSQTNPLAPTSYYVTTKDGTVADAFVNTGRNVYQGYNYLYDADGGYVGFSWNGLLSSQFEQFAPSLTLLGTVPLANGFASNLSTMLSQNTSLSTTGSAMLSGNVSGPGSLTLTGGTLSLYGNNTYTGGTDIAGGTLVIQSDSNLGASAGTLTFSGGALQTVSTMTSPRAVLLNSLATIQPDANTTLTLSGLLSGSGGVAMTGDGKLSLQGNNTYTGGTTIAKGTLVIQSDSNLGASSGGLTFSGGALQTVSTMTSARAVALNSTATIQPDANTTLTLSGPLTGSGGVAMTGDGTLSLSASNTYTGGTALTGGTLVVSNDRNLGASSGPLTFSGGALQTVSTMTTDRAVALNSLAMIQPDANTTLKLSGLLSGSGGIAMLGDGTLSLSGNNTFSGGTGVFSGTLAINGSSPTGTGPVYIAPGALLTGTGTIAGALSVAGTLKHGNSPGYLATQSAVNMLSGSTYVQDIAGTTQASAATPVGANGYYSFLKVSGAAVAIESGATLAPRLQNLFSPSEPGYGSAPFTPAVGDKFRILTADSGITGKFTTLLQPAGLASGTQFITFYNYNGSNSLDLVVVPTSFNAALAASGNKKNAQSVGSALDKMVAANQSGTSSTAQDQVLYNALVKSASTLPAYTQGMAGEIFGATLAVVPQTTQRLQQAILTRLGDSMFAPTRGASTVTSASNSAISFSNPGGQPTAGMSSNPSVNPYRASFSNGAAWGEVAYQYGNRASDSNSGGWTSNLVQAVVGGDAYSEAGIRVGGGIALSNTNVSADQVSGNVQQSTVFLYGKLPVEQFVVDAVASYGFNSTDNTRSDVTGLTNGLQAKGVKGNDALISLGLSLPIELEAASIAPYGRVTWQQVTQNGFSEGNAASALTVNSYNGNGVRGVIGVTAGSKATNPITEKFTYRANVGVGMDSSTLLSPTLNASLVGAPTQIYTPNPGAAFVQIGLFATAKFADNAYSYVGITTELRSGQTLVGGNIGAMIQF